jgi:ABC-type Mn2+/Zn2+ transport system permease subunit
MKKINVLLLFAVFGLVMGIVLTLSEYNRSVKRAVWIGPVSICVFAIGLIGVISYKIKHVNSDKLKEQSLQIAALNGQLNQAN